MAIVNTTPPPSIKRKDYKMTTKKATTNTTPNTTPETTPNTDTTPNTTVDTETPKKIYRKEKYSVKFGTEIAWKGQIEVDLSALSDDELLTMAGYAYITYIGKRSLVDAGMIHGERVTVPASMVKMHVGDWVKPASNKKMNAQAYRYYQGMAMGIAEEKVRKISGYTGNYDPKIAALFEE
jgi:hypothetical protein